MNTIGLFFLNISFFLYLVVYLPQILHNIRAKHLNELSLIMHYLLFSAYGLDLFYGFLMDYQWQYKIVSLVGFSLFIIQHLQILTHDYFYRKKYFLHNSFLFLSMIGSLFLAFTLLTPNNTTVIFYCGTISRIFFLIAMIPQLVKNKKLKSAKSISVHYLYLNFLMTSSDFIAAWCLNWGWPNKLGSPLSLCITGYLIYQSNTEFSRILNKQNYEKRIQC